MIVDLNTVHIILVEFDSVQKFFKDHTIVVKVEYRNIEILE